MDHLHALLLGFAPRERIKPGLSRISALCQELGHPETTFKAVHIAGTNGKGSTAALLSAALTANGLRVGLYSSPHLHGWCERIQVDRKPIKVSELTRSLEQLAPLARRVGATTFELVTAVAFDYFSHCKVDIAVVESGLGGRFDATNVVHPVLTMITGVDYDHMDLLGPTLRGIAWEKAGIAKPRVPMVAAPLPAVAHKIVAETCEELGATLTIAKPLSRGGIGDDDNIDTPWGPVRLAMQGQYQRKNLATAVAGLGVLSEFVPLEPARVVVGLSTCSWPGRFERIRSNPTILLDAAHNLPGAVALLESLKRLQPASTAGGPRRWLLFAIRKDKAYGPVAQHLFPWFDRILLVAKPGMGGLDPMLLLPYALKQGHEAQVCGSIELALGQFESEALPQDLLCVAGSLNLVGEARWRLSKRAV